MRPGDLLHLAAESLFRARLRSAMMLIAMAIGVAAVVVLTSLGEGARAATSRRIPGARHRPADRAARAFRDDRRAARALCG